MKLDFAAGGVRQVTVNTKSNAVALTTLQFLGHQDGGNHDPSSVEC